MEKDLLFRDRILHPHLLSPGTHPTTLLPSAQPHQDSITVSEGEDPASLVPGVIRTLPTSVWARLCSQETYSLGAQFLLYMERTNAFPAGG